jgi:hypothetical protein
MSGLNYAAAGPRRLDPLAALHATTRPLRIACAILFVTVAGLAGATAAERQRIALADARLVELRSQAMSAATAARRAAAGDPRDHRVAQFAGRLAAVRNDTLRSSNAAIRIGNALPPRTWLVQLDAVSGGWTIAGKSMSIGEIGATLRALQRLDERSSAHLVSVSSNALPHRPYDFVISWERPR